MNKTALKVLIIVSAILVCAGGGFLTFSVVRRFVPSLQRVANEETTLLFENNEFNELLSTSEYEAETFEEKEESTQPETSSSPVDTADDIVHHMSAEEVRLANVFLSNFSEAFVYDIDATNENDMINFAAIHIIINYSNLCKTAETPLEIYNAQYDRYDTYDCYISASDIHGKIERFFGKKLDGHNTDRYIYRDGKYFYPFGGGESHCLFTKISTGRDNGDGTISFNYIVYSYDYDAYGVPPDEVYPGTAGSVTSKDPYSRVSTGTALLEKANPGAGLAPYRVISLSRSDDADSDTVGDDYFISSWRNDNHDTGIALELDFGSDGEVIYKVGWIASEWEPWYYGTYTVVSSGNGEWVVDISATEELDSYYDDDISNPNSISMRLHLKAAALSGAGLIISSVSGDTLLNDIEHGEEITFLCCAP